MPKSIISAYLSFFPVTIGMVKGLTSPEVMQLDLMRTYNASRSEVFFKLRLPAAVPFLFASLKVAIAIALTGAIVGELPTGAQAGSAQGSSPQLLRPNGANLGGAFRRCHQRRAAGLHDCCDREADRTTDGSAVMMAGPGAVLLLGLAAAAALIGMLLLAQSAPGGGQPVLDRLLRRLGAGLGVQRASCRAEPSRCKRAQAEGFRRACGFWRNDSSAVGDHLHWRRRADGADACALPDHREIHVRTAHALGGFRSNRDQAVIPGWAIGSALGVLVAILCDRVDFLRRGLLPLGNFVAALPIIGIAPIMVMWFGFDWQSKMAVVIIMTFFPALVNAVAGLAASGHLERDLMKSYGASSFQTLLALKLPVAMPFIFNALKINATLALIGAIVAEFFGTPIVAWGSGFPLRLARCRSTWCGPRFSWRL